MVEGYAEFVEVGSMLMFDLGDQLFRSDAFAVGAQHDGRAVSVVGADIIALVTAHFLKSHPDVGLDIFDKMAQMDRAVGIRQGAGNKNFSIGHGSMVWCDKMVRIMP